MTNTKLNDNSQLIRVRDYTKTPGPRYEDEGKFSGQWFRSTVLEPAFEHALATSKTLTVDLDGTHGFATSFLEEVFGGLARKYGGHKVLRFIEVICNEEEYLKEDIEEYVNDVIYFEDQNE